jgi:hypothetical protein
MMRVLNMNSVTSFRIFILTLLAFSLNTIRAEDAAPQTRWQRNAEQKKEQLKDVTWLTHEPIEFLMRRGDHFDDEPERYERMLEPENLKRMAAGGVRYGRLFFYKGFGLEYERPNMEKAKRAVYMMHQLGMKVDLYMAGTMFTETLYHELPKAKNWEQRDQNNQWVPYGIQTFRHYACPNEPAYRDYLKRILKIAVEELHADQISFDNLMLQPEPKSCRCPRCIKAFHDFLRQKYPTTKAVRRRFGLPNVDWIVVNEWSSESQPDGLNALNDPVLQEWVRFRCESLARYADDLSAYVKSLNPNVAVLMNIKGLYSFNRYWANAIYHPLYAGHIDIMSFDIGGYEARIDPNTSALVSQIRSYKVARRLKASCEESLRDDLWAAIHMGFGYETPVSGYAGAPYISYATTAMGEFYREYLPRYYTGTEEVADVAVLRNWPSMAYSINAAHVPATLMEQVLIQHKIPFDILFDEDLTNLNHYQAIILAGQECVGNAQADLLLSYVRNGGTLVIAGNTGQYNGWRERRHKNPFLPARAEGKGRIVYIPEIVRADSRSARTQAGDQNPEPGATLQRTPRMTPSQWVLPKNHEAIAKTVVDGMPKGLSVQTDAPLTTVLEMLNRPSTRETIVHLINFEREQKTTPVHMTLRRQFDGPVKSVQCFSPEHDEPVSLDFKEADGHIDFMVPSEGVYSMVVVAHRH